MILCSFFAVLIIVIPGVFICYYQRTMHYAPNGVLIETLQFLGYYMNEATRVKNCPELLAASAESRSMVIRPGDNQGMVPIMNQAVEHKKRQFGVPIITKNQFLLWAHMQRLHHLFTPDLQEDCDQLLRFSVKITQAMVEIACMREWFFTAQAMIEFRRCLIQALDVKSSSLLQIPHFSEDVLRHCHRGKNAVAGLADFLSKDPAERKGTANMDAQQLQDIEAFVAHMSDVEVKAAVEVEDEEEIVIGDVCTVTASLLRKNLKEGECLGPVHAPFFPRAKVRGMVGVFG
jgi:translocation protein SEC63